ncbi:MAG: hypothetical protein MZV64_45675 [Ignavibacteriales bacterium]|nr:hypothetical protein [Ignavibacteriales bacterium]
MVQNPGEFRVLNLLPKIDVKFRTEKEGFYPYLRDENLARPWAIPGTPDLEHRIGGLEKANIYGTVNYDPDNHNKMIHLRAEKIKNIENDIPDLEVDGEQQGELLVLGWGGTYGAIKEAVIKSRAIRIKSFSSSFADMLNPFPKNTGDVLKKFNKVLIPEINLGQLSQTYKK